MEFSRTACIRFKAAATGSPASWQISDAPAPELSRRSDRERLPSQVFAYCAGSDCRPKLRKAPASEPEQHTKGRNSAKPPHQNRNNTPKAETPQSPRIRTGTTHQRPKLRTSHQIMRDDRRTRREPGQDYAANAAGDAVRSVFCPDAPERLEGDVPVRRDQPRHVGKLGMRFKVFCRDRPQHPVVRGHGIIPPFA